MPSTPAPEYRTLDHTTPRQLERDLPPTDVLSVVLNVNPASDANQGDNLRLRARALLSTVAAPEVLVQAVMDNLNGAQHATKTRAYFLWEEHRHLRQCFVDAQISLPESVRYGAPDLEPLHYALESDQRVVIALVDREWGRLFSVHLGRIHELLRLENVMEPDDSFREHLAKGGVHPDLQGTDSHQDSGRRLLSRDSDNDHLGDRAAQQDQRFYRALVTRLSQLSQVGAFERLIVAGTERARAGLIQRLTPELTRACSGEVLARGDASASTLLEEARGALERSEDSAQQALLNEAEESGVYGLSATLKAAQEGRVSELLVEHGGSGQQLWRDESGVLSSLPPSPASPGSPDTNHLKLSDVLPQLRQQYGLHVHVISGEQATRLHDQMGGLAGLLRY